ncbi:MAG: non-canonical purine NTP pyrophosphatase [Deltaproteobacteria bacterium]|nr:non-canonical purine NTP pyrophosphatase [Deltaproteobacteria bacterium]MBV8454806.1 non-canonical purine NTP pyrophosphatase [Deltaproteobacteria bacterium]
MTQLLIATTNPAKLAEYSLLLREFNLQLVSLRDASIDREAPEDAATFSDNARNKAAFYFIHSGLPTLADDGGLEVDALGGAPGVQSHRWLGAQADDRQLAEEVIRRMAGVEPASRTARLRAAAALIYTDQGVICKRVAEAALEGIIAERCYPAIRPGFPYRSVLYLPERGCYLAEVNEQEAASHLSQRHLIVAQLAKDLRRLATAG